MCSITLIKSPTQLINNKRHDLYIINITNEIYKVKNCFSLRSVFTKPIIVKDNVRNIEYALGHKNEQR